MPNEITIDTTDQYQFTSDELNDFLGPDAAAMVPEHMIKSEGGDDQSANEAEAVEEEAEEKEAGADKNEEQLEDEELSEEAAEEEGEFEENEPEKTENNELSTLKEELAALKSELAEFQEAAKQKKEVDEPKEELSVREQLGLPDLESEEFKDAFELEPGLKKVMAAQQAAVIKQHEQFIEHQKLMQQNTNALEQDQTAKFWHAVGTTHEDYSDYVTVDGKPTSKASEWIDEQPSFLQGAYRETLEKGGSNAVSELLTMIKGNGKKEAAAVSKKNDTAEKQEKKLEEKVEAAKKKLAEAEEKKSELPSSLSSVSGEAVDNPFAAIEGSSDPIAAARRATGGNLRKFQDEILDKMVA
jgi:hypothetical protein